MNKKNSKKISVAQVQDEPSRATEETISAIVPEEVPVLPAVEIPAIEIDSITQRTSVIDGPIIPIDVIENIKLESYVNKTIVNDNNVVDVPVYQEKDKMLEEVKKLISEPTQEPTTLQFTTTVETTTIIVTTETTTERPTTTIPIEETTSTTKTPIILTPAPETETIFDPIKPDNNENINLYEENISVLTTTESSPRVSFLWAALDRFRLNFFSDHFYDFISR